MSRTILVIRHAKSVGGRYDRHLYPKQGAPLSEQGFEDAKKLNSELLKRGFDVENEPVAISELIRTRQTADMAGLKVLNEYRSLNEVNTGLQAKKLEQIIRLKKIPKKATEAAKQLLKNPPKENIWITHCGTSSNT